MESECHWILVTFSVYFNRTKIRKKHKVMSLDFWNIFCLFTAALRKFERQIKKTSLDFWKHISFTFILHLNKNNKKVIITRRLVTFFRWFYENTIENK